MTQKWKTKQTTPKIYKPHINGKPKRPGTHQYPYLGIKVAVVAEKLDPTVDQLCFCCIFQTVRSLQKKYHGNEFRGSKNGGKEVWVFLKWPKNTKIRRPKLAAAAAFASPIRARPAAAGWEILPAWSFGRPPPPWPARVQWWWLESAPTAETISA